jgi:hypothetical protein
MKRPARRLEKRHVSLRKLLLLIILIGIVFFFLGLRGKYWNGKDKLSLGINKSGGEVIVASFDPANGEITTISIPENTQVQVARQLGTWKIGSVWQLGKNEKLGGQLLAETITKNFRFPVFLWADESSSAFTTGNFWPTIKAILNPGKTNVGLGDRVRIGLFSLSVKNTNRININLKETNCLKKTRLVDGEEGYLISGTIPGKITSAFSEEEISSQNLKAIIKDATQKPTIPERVGEIIEVLGIKVGTIKKEEKKDLDCEVLARQDYLRQKIARLFSCIEVKGQPEGNFDLEVRIGEKFAKRY